MDQLTIQDRIAAGQKSVARTYAPAPVVMSHGEGMMLYDTEGRAYLDFLGGIAVSCLGHAHPALVETLQRQVGRLLHISNAFWSEPQLALQSLLVERSGLDRVFFTNSGTESNEAAIKIARRYQRVIRGTPRFEIITFQNSFHGRSYAAVSATAQPKYHAGFEPMVPGFLYATFNDLASVEALISPHTAAILVEPVQGEGGVRPATPEFLQGLRALCDREGLLLMFDEVQSGVGRLGSWFGSTRYGVRPDVMTLAKGLGGGVPIGAMLSTEAVSEGFTRGSHASTFGGNALATAAGVCVLETLERDGLLEQTERVGAYFREQARQRVGGHSRVEDVRGLGWLNGIALRATMDEANAVVMACRERGLLCNTAGGTVIRFVPPLIATESDVNEALNRFSDALTVLD
jgi:acetylornithine/N-succinyldiaminopimelate aminotransferase